MPLYIMKSEALKIHQEALSDKYQERLEDELSRDIEDTSLTTHHVRLRNTLQLMPRKMLKRNTLHESSPTPCQMQG